MAGTGSFTVSRSHSGDRFYNPPAMRRQQQQQQQLMLQRQEQLQRQQLQPSEKSSPPSAAVVESENRTGYGDSTATLSKVAYVSPSPPASPATSRSNLENLVETVTPLVPAQYCPEVNITGRRSREARQQPFYCLGDLWESLREWSAYGAGVPLLLNGTDSVKQYYVPYLSGMQLYVDPQKLPSKNRSGEESDANSSTETCSCAFSDCEADKQTNCVKDGHRSQPNLANLNSQQLNSLSPRNNSLNSSSGDEGEISNSPGQLVFEFFEREKPYIRKPLADKISVLESQFPKLSLYRSCDLLPRSWISIAWYPIYRIPMGSTLKDLDASFLTIHSLSTQSSSQPQLSGESGGLKVNGVGKASSKISLPVLGLASYKYKGSILSPSGLQECEKENSLLQAANDWLQGLSVVLPDFQFFQSHYYLSWRR